MGVVLVGCEESQAVTIVLRKRGHEAYSCDLQECSGGHPEWHLQMDVFEAIAMRDWDAGIFFPDCTYLTVSCNRWNKDQPPLKSGKLVGAARREARDMAIEFFLRLYNCDIERVAIENPVGIMSSHFRKPDQIIQPYQFGHGEIKKTGFWLRGFPLLKPTNVVEGRKPRIHHMSPSKDRSKLRSKTYLGVAEAMADQWFNCDSTYFSNKCVYTDIDNPNK